MQVIITIDGKDVKAEKDRSILAAALDAGIYIPHLCHHPNLHAFREVAPIDKCYRGEEAFHADSQSGAYDGCGLCVVTITGREGFTFACDTLVEEGMEVDTLAEDIQTLRRGNLGKILSRHPHACLTCAQREGCSLTQCSLNVPENERCCLQFNYCELRKVAEYIGIEENIPRYQYQGLYSELDKPLFIRDYNLCIGCLRCVRVCFDVVGAASLGYVRSGEDIIVGSVSPTDEESYCRYCGACVEVCPTGTLRDKGLKAGDRKSSLVPCIAGCPVAMDIPSYVRAVAQKDYDAAAGIINESVPLALSLGYICNHPCEESCRRGELNHAVAICAIKRLALEKGGPKQAVEKRKKTGKKVAIAGAGPAGLVAAYYLAAFGHEVVVYETAPEPGGMLRWAIPEYRLPPHIMEKEVRKIEALGVKIFTSSPASREDLLRGIENKKWDALLLASGLQIGNRIDVEGNELDGVYWGLDLLKAVRKGEKIDFSGKVAVIGGGDVAMDVAMIALRLGAACVELACLEKREEMPASGEEITEAEEEGVVVNPGWGPSRIERERNSVKGVELISCISVFDEKGSFNPQFDDTCKKVIEASAVILAVGQRADLSFLPLELEIQMTAEGTIKVDPETLETNVPGIFAGGEAASGPGSAAQAMAMGKRAAGSIDRYLGGEGFGEPLPSGSGSEGVSLWRGQEEGFAGLHRISMRTISPEDRRKTFELVKLGFSEEEATREAGRCLGCDLRFHISPMTLPPEKWLQFTAEILNDVPESEGAYQLLDENKKVVYIAGTLNLRQSLQEQLASCSAARYFVYEVDPMYTIRESELMQQHLQKHGCLPAGNEEIDDMF